MMRRRGVGLLAAVTAVSLAVAGWSGSGANDDDDGQGGGATETDRVSTHPEGTADPEEPTAAPDEGSVEWSRR